MLDASNIVNTGAMNKNMLSSFAKGIATEIRRERPSGQHGGCGSVIRDGDINKPVGQWPKDWIDVVHEEKVETICIEFAPNSVLRC